MPISAGTRLGPYEIVAQVGAGGMGEAYQARDTRPKDTIPIKPAKMIFVQNTRSRSLTLPGGPRVFFSRGAPRTTPLLSKEGEPRSGGVVCSKLRSDLINAREALLINRYRSSLNRPPQPSLREGIPRLTKAGNGSHTI